MASRFGVRIALEDICRMMDHLDEKMIARLKSRVAAEAAQPVMVADAGLFTRANLALMEGCETHYIVGTRLKNHP